MAREQRLLDEHALTEEGFTIERWSLTAGGELCVNFRLALPQCEFNGALIYPDLFPDVPAYIRPRKHGERWSGHQYKGTGMLCLQYGPDNWNPAVTGVDLVRSANLLLWNEALIAINPAFDAVQSRHGTTFGSDLRGKPCRFVVTRGLRLALLAKEAITPLSFSLRGKLAVGTNVVLVTGYGKPTVAITDVPHTYALESITVSGMGVLVDSVDGFEGVNDDAALREKLGTARPWPIPSEETIHFLVLHDARG